MAVLRSTYTESLNFYGKETPESLLEKFGSPLYVYNEKVLRTRCQDLRSLSKNPNFKVSYSVKANANLSLLKIIKSEGLMVDAMSPGELYFDRLAGFTNQEILYIANNIDIPEMQNLLLPENQGILLSIDSLMQLENYAKINPGGKIILRFNLGIGAGHHAKVITGGKETKFGISAEDLSAALEIIATNNLQLAGINQHIGSLFMTPDNYLAAAQLLLDFVETLPKSTLEKLEIVDFGGGFGIPYHKYDQEARLDLKGLSEGLDNLLNPWSSKHNWHGSFIIEPGRYIVAESGIILTKVNNVKYTPTKCFVGTDVGFNVLMRPMLYDSFHDFEVYPPNYPNQQSKENRQEIDLNIVGNICETGDILAKERKLPRLYYGDILGILDSGAYGFAMSSNYTCRLRPAEVLICQDGSAKLIRRREKPEDLAKTCLEID